MHYYKTTLRLNGNLLNEVVKTVSAPEFLILQIIHGDDALVNVKEIGNEKISLVQEKQRLKDLYEMGLIKRDQSIDQIFGALGTIPDRLPSHLLEAFNIDEESPEAKILEEFRKAEDEDLFPEEDVVSDLMG